MDYHSKSKDDLIKELLVLQHKYDDLKAIITSSAKADNNLVQSEIVSDIHDYKARNKAIMDALPDLLFLYDKDGNYLEIHTNNTNELIAPIDDLIGHNIKEFLDTNLYELVSNAIKKCIEKKESTIFEYELDLKNGKNLYETRFVPVVDDTVLSISRNITERKKYEEALINSEEKFRMIAENTSDVIWTMDSNLNYTYISPSIYHQRGFTPEEFLKLKQKDIYTEKSIAKLNESYQQHAKLSKLGNVPKGYNLTLEVEHKCKDGSIALGEVLINPLINDSGDIIGIHGTTRNITERKRMETMLLQQNNILKGVSEATYSLLVTDDFDLAINKAISQLGSTMGIDRVNICKTNTNRKTKKTEFGITYQWINDTIIAPVNKDRYTNLNFEEFAPNWFNILSKGDAVNALTKKHSFPEKSILTELGIMSVLLMPIYVGNEFWGFIGFDDCNNERLWSEGEMSILKALATSIAGAIELTRNKHNLVKTKEHAIASDNLKTCLLLNMSHELRTPMNGILGFAEILWEESDGHNQELAERILISGRRLMKTLNTIMELSQLESGVKEIEYKEANISEEIANVIEDNQELAAKKKLELVSVVRKNIICKIEPNLFSKIISNIIENAIKFTKEGGVVIEADITEVGKKEFVEVKIKDSGIGIAPENQEIIFNEFKQISEGYSRSYEGVGLGLTLALKMVKLLNGTISVESKINVGSIFTVTIPCLHGTYSRPILAATKIANVDVQPDPEKELPLVLLVEDNKMNIYLIIRFLNHTCKVDFATDAEAAITKAKENNYKAILLDINLSDEHDGIYALNEIRKLDHYKATPIVAVTGYTMYGDKEKLIEAGCTHYIPKPFTRNDIKVLMNEVLALNP